MLPELDGEKPIELLRLHPLILQELYKVIHPLKDESGSSRTELIGNNLWNTLKKTLPSLDSFQEQNERREFEYGMRLMQKSLKNQFNASPFRSVFRIASRFDVNLVLIEFPYLDLEYWESFSHLYSKTFSSIPRAGCRMHFFRQSDDLQLDKIKAYFEGSPAPTNKTKEGKNGETIIFDGLEYYGFSILRPTPNFKVGRTALAFDRRSGKDLNQSISDDIDKRTHPICTSLITLTSNVLSRSITIKSVPFMQQDPIVGVCASTATWVSFQVVARKFQLNDVPYWDISKYAFGADKDYVTGKEFGRGLYPEDIRRAFENAGANPYMIPKQERHILKRYIFSLVDSNIPPVVCLSGDTGTTDPGHAVAVVAYALPDPSKHSFRLPAEKDGFGGKDSFENQYFLADFVERYYVHDDSYGPFNRLTIKPEATYLKRIPDNLVGRFALSQKKRINIDGMVVPFSPYVKSLPDSIAHVSMNVMKKIFFPMYAQFLKEPNILWRFVLVEGTRFKRSLFSRGYCDEHIKEYSKIHMSKYIWLAEFSVFGAEGKYVDQSTIVGEDGKRRIDGEFIFDATYPSYSARSISFRAGDFLTSEHVEDWDKSLDLLSLLKEDNLLPTRGETRQVCFPNLDSI